MSSILNPRVVITRKPHICFGCAREFPKGTKMELSCIVDGGTLWTCYLCPTCMKLTQKMRYDDEYGCGDLLKDALKMEAAESEN